MKCKHHGPAAQGVWACPTCLVELRKENQRLREVIRQITLCERHRGTLLLDIEDLCGLEACLVEADAFGAKV